MTAPWEGVCLGFSQVSETESCGGWFPKGNRVLLSEEKEWVLGSKRRKKNPITEVVRIYGDNACRTLNPFPPLDNNKRCINKSKRK